MDSRHSVCEGMGMLVQTILFDLDDTLIVDEAISKAAMERTANLAAKLHGADIPRFLADTAAISRSLWEDNPVREWCAQIGITAEECLWGEFSDPLPECVALHEWSVSFRHALFDSALRSQGLTEDDGSLAAEFSHARRKLQRLMPDAKETLARIKPGFRLGLLTNGAPSLQREKIAASGLAEFFQAITVSGEHGIGKPRTEIFHILLHALDARPETTVMVGNSLARDIAGAHAAGIAHTIWLQVPGSEEFAEVTPAHTIQGLHELPSLL